MTDTKKDEPEPTLEEHEERLLWLEGIATDARDDLYSARYVLGNLIIRLANDGVIDGKEFILFLLAGSPTIEALHHRLATEAFLEDLLSHATEPPPAGAVFH